MPFIGLSVIFAIIAIVHVIKTGRSQLWIMVLLSLPGLGLLAYVVVEVLPELLQGNTSRRVSGKVSKALNQGRTFDEAKRDYELSGSAHSACHLADLHCERREFSEAVDLYQGTLNGFNEHNPDIMFKLATAQFNLQRYDQTRNVLDELISKNPDYKNQDAHLLYARALEALGEADAAIEEYEALIKYYTGPEPAYHFAKLLQQRGESDRSRALFHDIVKKADLSPKFYRKMHAHWISLARKEL